MKTKHLFYLLFGAAVFTCSAAYNHPVSAKGNGGGNNGSVQNPPSDTFVRITTNGKYRYIAGYNNRVGDGETVDISKEFYISKYAVTNAEWDSFVKATGASAPKYWDNGCVPIGRENHPVLWVSYNMAVKYCDWLTGNSDEWKFRLPTQAEWEYAAAGKNGCLYPWGDSSEASYDNGVLDSKFNYNGVTAAKVLKAPDRIAIYNNEKSKRYGEQERVGDIISIRSNGIVDGWVSHSDYTGFIYTDIFAEINGKGGYTCAVDAYPEGVSWCGCYNMAGNCWEWTSTIEVARNGAEKGQKVNIIRGGSWYATAHSCRVSYRGEGRKPSGAYNTVGLRVVAEKKT